jgi:deglycase
VITAVKSRTNTIGEHMTESLKGKKIAIIATDGVEEVELVKPREAVEQAGAETELLSVSEGQIQAMNGDIEPADKFPVDKPVGQASANDYDGLILPGGTVNADKLRIESDVTSFVTDYFKTGKPVGVICHGPWTLVEADLVRGRTLTSWPSLQTDIRNAGGEWVDKEVVVDEGLVTSRKSDDLPAFCAKIVEEFAEGVHEVASAGATQSS